MRGLTQFHSKRRSSSGLSSRGRSLEKLSLVGFTLDGMLRMGCLCEMGHKVVGVGVAAEGAAEFDAWADACAEPYLVKMLEDAADAGLVNVGLVLDSAVEASDATLVCVDVPVAADGRCDLMDFEAAVHGLGDAIGEKHDFHTVVVCSSVPPGTTMGFVVPALERASGGIVGVDFGVAVWPMVLPEGQSVDAFFRQTRAVIAASDMRAARQVKAILAALDCEVIETSFAAAELSSYTARAWQSLKLGFATEVAQLCRALDVAAIGDVLPTEVRPAGGAPEDAHGRPASVGRRDWKRQTDAVRALGFFAESLCIAVPEIVGLAASTALHPFATHQPNQRELH